MTNMDEKKKPVKPQNPLMWLLGQKETEEQRKAREKREAQDKRSREVIDNAVKKGALPTPGKKK